MSAERAPRRFTPPLGWPIKFRAVAVTPADRPRLVMFNRYPRQVIGIAFRLPNEATSASGRVRHKQLSILWAKPARWWKR